MLASFFLLMNWALASLRINGKIVTKQNNKNWLNFNDVWKHFFYGDKINCLLKIHLLLITESRKKPILTKKGNQFVLTLSHFFLYFFETFYILNLFLFFNYKHPNLWSTFCIELNSWRFYHCWCGFLRMKRFNENCGVNLKLLI